MFHHEFHIVKTLMLCRFFRLATLVRYSHRMLIRMGVEEKRLEIFKLSFYWFICIHWAACLQLYPGLIIKDITSNDEGAAWFHQSDFWQHSSYGRYAILLYKAVKTFMGVGNTVKLKPTELYDKIYASLITIFGRVGLCITMAYIFQIVQGMRSSSLRYEEMMVQLSKYNRHNKLPSNTKTKMKNNYDYLFRKRFFNEQEILKTVSATLRQQILFHNTRQLVEHSPFFANLPSNLIMRIISSLSVELYLEGDIIYTFGENGMSVYPVYFISTGSVAIMSPRGKEVAHIADGDYFGELTLVADKNHHYTKVIALETTECYK